MSINVFKKYPGNKITLSDRAILCGELKVMGSRPKVIFCVHGSSSGVTMGWLLRLVTGAPLVVGGPDSS